MGGVWADSMKSPRRLFRNIPPLSLSEPQPPAKENKKPPYLCLDPEKSLSDKIQTRGKKQNSPHTYAHAQIRISPQYLPKNSNGGLKKQRIAILMPQNIPP